MTVRKLFRKQALTDECERSEPLPEELTFREGVHGSCVL